MALGCGHWHTVTEYHSCQLSFDDTSSILITNVSSIKVDGTEIALLSISSLEGGSEIDFKELDITL